MVEILNRGKPLFSSYLLRAIRLFSLLSLDKTNKFALSLLNRNVWQRMQAFSALAAGVGSFTAFAQNDRRRKTLEMTRRKEPRNDRKRESVPLEMTGERNARNDKNDFRLFCFVMLIDKFAGVEGWSIFTVVPMSCDLRHSTVSIELVINRDLRRLSTAVNNVCFNGIKSALFAEEPKC